MSDKQINVSLLIDAMKPVFSERGLSADILRQQEMPAGIALLFNVTKPFGKSRIMTITVDRFLFAPPLPAWQKYTEHAGYLAEAIADCYQYLDDQERTIKALLDATPEQVAVLKLLGEKGGRVELPDAKRINPRGVNTLLDQAERRGVSDPLLSKFLPYAQLQRTNLITVESLGLFPPYAEFTNLGYFAYRMICDDVAIRVIDQFGDDFYIALKKEITGLNFNTTVREIAASTPPVFYIPLPDGGHGRVELKRWRSWTGGKGDRIGFSPEVNTLFVVKKASEADAE